MACKPWAFGRACARDDKPVHALEGPRSSAPQALLLRPVLIVEHDERWGVIEVKLSDAKADEGARNLKALERKVLSNPAAQNAAPAFLAVVVGKGEHRLYARRRRGGDPHGGAWGVAVLRGAGCRVSITEKPFVNPAPVSRIKSTAVQVVESWAAPLLGQGVNALMAATRYASNAA